MDFFFILELLSWLNTLSLMSLLSPSLDTQYPQNTGIERPILNDGLREMHAAEYISILGGGGTGQHE